MTPSWRRISSAGGTEALEDLFETHDALAVAELIRGRKVGAPRIDGRTAEGRLRRRRQAELAGIAAAHDDEAGAAHAGDRGAVLKRHRLLREEARADRGRRAGAVCHELLHDEGNTVERPVARRCNGFRQQLTVVEIGDGVQPAVDLAQAFQAGIEHFAGADLATADQLGNSQRILCLEQIFQCVSSASVRGSSLRRRRRAVRDRSRRAGRCPRSVPGSASHADRGIRPT